MTPRQDLAIVLRLAEYSETSQIVMVFTAQHGLLRLIAKGARRSTKTKFATGLDLLEHGELGFLPARGDAQLGILTDWRQRDTFAGLRQDLLRLYSGLYAAELVTGLTEEADPHVDLFAALSALLHDLARSDGPAAPGTSPAGHVTAFQRALLHEIGYAPELEHCVDCRRPPPRGAPAFFSAAAGGLLCRDCEPQHVEKRRVSPQLITVSDVPNGAEWFASDPAAWFDLFDYYLTYLAGRRFRTAATLAKLLASPPRGGL